MNMSKDKELPVQDHIIELLERLRRALISVIISSVAVSIFPDPSSHSYRPLIFSIMDRVRRDMTDLNNPILRPLANIFGVKEINIDLIAYSWIDSIEVILMLSLLFGLVISSPYIAKQIYDFVEPALEEREKRIIIPFVLGFSILFSSGVIYAYFVVMPLTIFFLSLIYIASGIKLIFSIEQFFSFIITGLVIVGLFFTFPLIIAVLSYLDILRPEALREKFSYIFFIVLVILAIVTPDPTPVSMIALSVPFLILYYLSYLLARKFGQHVT
ncbi:preprotein translocase subunit TatC [Candidatus Korarchaeum cryptofilum]|jgi:sec-independent protein translocase protein TatC|uniref:Sec-independent protein translocase protein TatC n=2 Tax=Candidatus Korarchaeum cryptofilum TaxID=498846 RepID=A0A3R9QRX3_9CREN|nr:preprotein translocase subunit TatC [Candidatus Korarchaeum cryptofilum]